MSITELLKVIERVDVLRREKHVIVAGHYARQLLTPLLTDGKQLFEPHEDKPIRWIYDITAGQMIYGSLE